MSIIAVIPARGGSKGIPRKNLTILAGKPLISYTIDAAKGAKKISKILVSTDDAEIAEVAVGLGAEVPFLRPSHLATDDAPMLGVMQHALSWYLMQGVDVEAVVLLQPTSPLRNSNHIEDAVRLFNPDRVSSVVSVVEVPHRYNPVSVLRMVDDERLAPFVDNNLPVTRRQDKLKCYARNGPSVLVCHPDTLMSGELYGDYSIPYVMSEKDSIDIDEPADLEIAELLINKKLNI